MAERTIRIWRGDSSGGDFVEYKVDVDEGMVVLDVNPDAVMCSTSRMIVKHKGASTPTVIACTLLPYDEQFEMGQTLMDSAKDVSLNHPHCARFCVLGGAACS